MKVVQIYNSVAPETNNNFCWPRPYVVWVANLKVRKRPEQFIELAEKCNDTGIDFLMIGRIDDRKYKYVEELQIGNFHYLGIQSYTKVNEVIKNALFLVHTCEPEGFPNNLIQAWLQGKPTVSLNFDPDGIIEKYQIGSFSKDFERMVEEVKQLIIDKEKRTEFGLRAKKMAEVKFNKINNVDHLQLFFNQLINANSLS